MIEKETADVRREANVRRYVRMYFVVTREALIQPVARLAHSFVHSYAGNAIWIDKQNSEAYPSLCLNPLLTSDAAKIAFFIFALFITRRKIININILPTNVILIITL